MGLASYLLIGFWNRRAEYAVAAKKAFVMNRVGDMGLIIAMARCSRPSAPCEFADVPRAVRQLQRGHG